MYEVAATKQESVLGVGEISGDLTDPAPVRRGGDSSDLDLAGLEVDYEQHEVANEPPPRDPFDREEWNQRRSSSVTEAARLPPARPAPSPTGAGVMRKAVRRRALGDATAEAATPPDPSGVGVRPGSLLLSLATGPAGRARPDGQSGYSAGSREAVEGTA